MYPSAGVDCELDGTERRRARAGLAGVWGCSSQWGTGAAPLAGLGGGSPGTFLTNFTKF